MSDEKGEGKRDRLTRRRFMQSAGIGALAAGGLAHGKTALGAQEVPEPKQPRAGGDPSTDYDAVVIGAGFAGVTAARELGANGLRILLLEARPRIGGRTFTSEIAGHAVELGGAFFHWTQPHAWTELVRYGLEIEEPERTEPVRSAWVSGGELKQGGENDIPLLAFPAAGAFFFDAMQLLPRPHDPLFVPAIAEAERQTVRDRLDGLKLPDDQRDILDAVLSTSCHGSLAEASVVEMLRWYTLPGSSMQNMIDAVGRYTLRGGTRTLIERMLADAKAEVRLATPVKSIQQRDGQAVVTTEGNETVSAGAVVVTVPLKTLGAIEFSPPLSPGKRAIASEGHAGSGVKLHIKVSGKLGTFTGLAPWPAPLTSLSTEYTDADGTVLTAFGGSGELLDINDDKAIQEAVRRMLPEAEVLWAAGYDWNVDPYSRGTWCVFGPGQLTRYLRELQRPEGRVFYAGGDNANGWRGFIDGAIEGGLRAAREVRQLLG
jgi:monoamine oxidase